MKDSLLARVFRLFTTMILINELQLRTKVLSRQMSCRNLRNTLRFLFTVLVLVVVQTSKSTQINRLGTQIPKE